MVQLTHLTSFNWQGRFPLIEDVRSFRDQIRIELGSLDSGKHWAYGLWRAGPEADMAALDYGDWPMLFLQAGGSAQRMTLEVRYREDDGKERQYVVGRPGGDYAGQPTEVVGYAGNSQTVYPCEVFDAEAATDVFYGYFQTDRVPAQYPLRLLDFSAYEK